MNDHPVTHLRENMKQVTKISALALTLFLFFLLARTVPRAQAGALHQQPTVAVPTVTSTQPNAIVTVLPANETINVRSGPSTLYPEVGVLIAGQQVPGMGRTSVGDWIQIAYPGVPGGVGWVYAPYVQLDGNLPVVEPPPTPTPQTTPTFDPTLSAEFQIEATVTRLPTFTPPPPLDIPTFDAGGGGLISTGIPPGYLIIALAVIGVFGIIISILGRR